jgi:hypothetical protein
VFLLQVTPLCRCPISLLRPHLKRKGVRSGNGQVRVRVWKGVFVWGGRGVCGVG